MTEPSIAQQMASFVNRTAWQDLPAEVRREGPRTLLNFFGVVFGACGSEVMETAMRGLPVSKGPCRILGRNERLDPVNAALINSLASAVNAFDDTHLSTITHPTGPVAAACLAVAQEARPSGEEFFAALVLGMEIECRLSEALLADGDGASIGWYITGVTGGIGAAAAASRLMKLDDAATASALGLAAAQASGLRGTHGSMSMAMIPAFAARNGISAALWAQAGMRCSPEIFEGVNGLFFVLAPNARPDAVLEGLGSRYAMLGNAYKPYPCGIVVHPVIDGCLDLLARGLDLATIERIDVAVHPVGKHLGDRKHPRSEFEAQVSIAHCTAVTLTTGSLGIEDLKEPWLSDDGIARLSDRVTVIADASLGRDQASVTVVTSAGERIEARIDHARGSLARPLTDDELMEKFLSQAGPVIGAATAAEFANVIVDGSGLDMERLLELVDSHASS